MKDKATEIIENKIERKAPETIVILGAPGSGKDTQAEYLVEALGYQVISTGELMRLLAGHDEEIRKMMENGELIPDATVEDELLSTFVLLPEGQPVILDGYPRNLEQAKKLHRMLVENNRILDRVIYINVSDEEVVKRIGKRRVCERCNLVQIGGDTCNKCGAKTQIRRDDKPDSIKKRLEVFHNVTEPVISYYKEQGIYAEVDGNPSPDSVREAIRRIL